MPNNVVSSSTMVNMTKYDRSYRLYIFFQIPYRLDIKKAEEVMLQVAEESKHVLHDYNKYKKPVVKLIEFQDSGVKLRLDVTVKNFANNPTVQSDLKKDLYVKLAENGIEAPYNRIEVSILNGEEEDGGVSSEPVGA
jgi:small-conductance mechanosensitive channel